jgi:hypothetical protein
VITVWPSCVATKSFTGPGAAFASLFPPMKWDASLCFAAYEVEPFITGTVPLEAAWALPFALTGAILRMSSLVVAEQLNVFRQ